MVCDLWISIRFVCFCVSRFVACDRNYDWQQRKTQLWRRLLNFRVRTFLKSAVKTSYLFSRWIILDWWKIYAFDEPDLLSGCIINVSFKGQLGSRILKTTFSQSWPVYHIQSISHLKHSQPSLRFFCKIAQKYPSRPALFRSAADITLSKTECKECVFRERGGDIQSVEPRYNKGPRD